ncbi:MAG: VOC family protein [Phycisphaerales bacterium]
MATIQRAHIVLAVPDLDRSRRWYEAVLGCVADEVDPGNWVFMVRDSVVFMLGRCPDAIPVADLGDHQYVAYLVVDDVDAFHGVAAAAMAGGGVGGAILKPPRDEAWGMREMALRTADGYRMMVATNIGRASLAWPVAGGPGR